jgi:magnesium chelatase family protein
MLDSMPYSTGAVAALADACSSGVLNGRGYDRVRRVALTIADLAGRDEIVEGDVAEASAFRGGW